MPAGTHFKHYVIPRNKLDLAFVDGFYTLLYFPSPGFVDVIVNFRVEAVDQRCSDFCTIRVRKSKGGL